MADIMINTIQLNSWRKLADHYQSIMNANLREWFDQDNDRFQKFSLEAADLFLDYSKNHVQSSTMSLLFELARECGLEQSIESLFSGGIVNASENRPALHTALRYSGSNVICVDGIDIMPEVHQTLTKMLSIAKLIHERRYLGFSGRPIDTILHFGIGGSDLGPLLVFEALEEFVDSGLKYEFFSFQDPDFVTQSLKKYDPATSLIIVASKSFTTSETLANASIAKQWLLSAAQQAESAAKQLFAVTAKPGRAINFGIGAEYVLPIWEWVGGRYSVWSAMSFIVAIAIGPQHFRQFLAGAEAMDRHFAEENFRCNIPVIMGLIDVWYNNFFKIANRAVIPYSRKLRRLPDHLQQVFMESLGKSVTQTGGPLECATGFVIWGGVGTNSQHSFHQCLLQGNQWTPVEFILPVENSAMAANCLAQSQVLMSGYSGSDVDAQQVITGNRPSHTILMPKISPFALGSLLALYEHRVFVNSVIWGINAFDQWGVERGKHIAQNILKDLSASAVHSADSSTNGLLQWIKSYEEIN